MAVGRSATALRCGQKTTEKQATARAKELPGATIAQHGHDNPFRYNPRQYKALSSSLMKPAHHTFSWLLRLLALTALLAGAMAQAQVVGDYAAITQLLKAGKPTEALTQIEQRLAANPRDPQLRFLRGVAQSDAGKTEEAIATFTQLTQDYPELPEPYNNLAVLYAQQNQFDKARVALEMAVRNNPSYATAHENLGDIYARLAQQSYAKALQLDPNNATVKPKLALLRELFQRPATTTRTPASAPRR